MNKSLIALFVSLAFAQISSVAAAPNIIRLGGATIAREPGMEAAEPTYTEWSNIGYVFGCLNWTPDADNVMESASFSQTSSNCQVNQERFRQNRLKNLATGEIIPDGEPIRETQVGSTSFSRNYSVSYSGWSDVDGPTGCDNWSPDASTVTWGESFTQEATDCEQRQSRTRVDTYDDYSGVETTLSRGSFYQILEGIHDSRIASGTRDGWIAIDPTFTDWVSTNELHSCSAWLPSASGISSSQTFTQQALNCKTDQDRQRQDREQLLSSGEIRNSGSPVVEQQTLTNLSASRSYTVSLGSWVNSGSIYGCSNWSPAPSTITINQNFTQTASDCEQNQSRTRSESYVDHRSGQTVAVPVPNEARTLTNQSSTRSATGTKETWVATTSTYTSWANSGGIYGCSNWSPATSTVNSGQQFTQTATDCEQNQTRSRQDREQETTTLAIRNKGSAVTESQTITVSSTRTATGTKETKVCQWKTSSPITMWQYNSGGMNPWQGYHRAYWEGTLILNSTGNPQFVTQVNYGGYKYTMTQSTSTLCREPL